MTSSTACNCRRNILQFTATSNLFLSLMFCFLRLSVAPVVWYSVCGPDAPITNGSALEGNLKVVLNSLVDNVNKTGYSNSSHGENGDVMYGFAQCRGDLNASACGACVSYASKEIGTQCNTTSARFNYVERGCFLRYDTHNLYSQQNLSDASLAASVMECDNVTINGTNESARGLDAQLDQLLTTVSIEAESSEVGYATGNESGIYGLAQCWRDLSMSQCKQCLTVMYNKLIYCAAGSKEGAAMNDYCMLRYDSSKFYGDGVPLLSPITGSGPSIAPSIGSGSGPSVQPSSGKNNGHRRPLVVGLPIAGVMIAVVLVGFVLIWKRKYNKQLLPGYYEPYSEYSTAISKSKLTYKFQILQFATKNFNIANKIGQGGFGSVYKRVLPDNREIAVKRLFSNREPSVSDFFNEVTLVSRIQHKNLVNLLGFSVDGPDKLLVYEYLPNKSLDHFLFGNVS